MLVIHGLTWLLIVVSKFQFSFGFPCVSFLKLFFEKNQTYMKAILCKGVCIVSCVVMNEEKVYVNTHSSVTGLTIISHFVFSALTR